MELPSADPCIVRIPTGRILRFLGGTPPSMDWHRILRQDLKAPLHLNLGIPGIEEPENPIEENPGILAAAVALGWDSVPVILSGELERALEVGLLTEKAMSNLRNRIRVSV